MTGGGDDDMARKAKDRTAPRDRGAFVRCESQGGSDASQELLDLPNGSIVQFAVHSTRTCNDLLDVLKSLLGSFKSLPSSAVLFVRKILGEGGSSSADAQAPALESSAFVGESCQIPFGFHRTRGFGFPGCLSFASRCLHIVGWHLLGWLAKDFSLGFVRVFTHRLLGRRGIPGRGERQSF